MAVVYYGCLKNLDINKIKEKRGDRVAVKMKEPRLAFPIEAMTQNFVFTNTQDVWAGYKIAHQVFPLNDLDFF